MAGYELEIQTAAENHKMIGIHDWNEAEELANYIQKRMDEGIKEVSKGNVNESSQQSNTEKLRELKSLHDDGIISKEEYEEKRKEILDRFWSCFSCNSAKIVVWNNRWLWLHPASLAEQ